MLAELTEGQLKQAEMIAEYDPEAAERYKRFCLRDRLGGGNADAFQTEKIYCYYCGSVNTRKLINSKKRKFRPRKSCDNCGKYFMADNAVKAPEVEYLRSLSCPFCQEVGRILLIGKARGSKRCKCSSCQKVFNMSKAREVQTS